MTIFTPNYECLKIQTYFEFRKKDSTEYRQSTRAW